MKVFIDESFEKDIKKVTDKKLLNQIADCIEEIIKTDKLSDISEEMGSGTISHIMH